MECSWVAFFSRRCIHGTRLGMRGKSFLLCFVLVPCGHAVVTEGEAFLSRLPVPLAVLGGGWGPGLASLGSPQVTRMLERAVGTEVLAAHLRHEQVTCPLFPSSSGSA